jgi:hypothetical protein
MKLQIIETPEYILAVSNEEITGFENNIWVFKGNRLWLWNNKMALRSNYKPNKVVGHQPKGNAPELDLPLLPEMVVEDYIQNVIEPLLKKKAEENNTIDLDAYALGLVDSYKSATKVYSDEDLRKAFEAGMYFIGED